MPFLGPQLKNCAQTRCYWFFVFLCPNLERIIFNTFIKLKDKFQLQLWILLFWLKVDPDPNLEQNRIQNPWKDRNRIRNQIFKYSYFRQ